MRLMLRLIVLLCVLAPLGAQTPYFVDNFDSYPLGQLASGTGGWRGWYGNPALLADIVATQAFSPPNALELNHPDDTILPFVLNDPSAYPTSGAWRLTAWWYIPSASFTGSGTQFLLLHNTYSHGGPTSPSLQLMARPSTMSVSEIRLGPAAPVQVMLDQWAQVIVDIDLTADWMTTYYNGAVVSTGPYCYFSGDPRAIACLDFWTTSSISVSYWDDIKLERLPPEYQLNQPGAGLDINGLSNGDMSPINAVVAANVPATLNLFSTNVGQLWDIALTIPEPSVPASGGGFRTPGQQIVNIDLFAPSLTYVNPPSPFTSLSLPLILPPMQLCAQMVVLDPGLPDLLSLSAANEITAVACPNLETFDSLGVGIVYPPGWNNGGGNQQWRIHSGPTPISSYGTGPTVANSAPNYLYCETNSTILTTYRVDTHTLDTSGIASPTLNFALSRIGASIGTLVVRQDDGSGAFPITLATYVGPDPTQAQGVSEWSMQTLPIDTTTPGAVPRFRFDYTRGASYTGNIAIDDVQVM